MALRELMTDPRPRHLPRHMDAWLAEHIYLPPALERLLADLEAPSPSIQEFEVDLAGDEFGDLFKDISASEGVFKVSGKVHLRRDEFGEAYKYSSYEAEKDARARVRLRVLRAIGNCTSLRTIHLNPSGKSFFVTTAEAGAFLEALRQSNHVLEMLDLSGCKGFGSTAACVALAGRLRTSRTLTTLDLWGVGLTSEGLRHIAEALQAPHDCSLQELDVGTNSSIGEGGFLGASGGAQYLAKIITHTSTLRSLNLYDIGMDLAGGQMIANALATNPSVEELSIGWEATIVTANQPVALARLSRGNQSAALTRILRALTPWVTQTGDIQISCHMPNVKTVGLVVVGDESRYITEELGEALASMLRHNTCLQTLFISTYLIGNGLEALTDNTSITTLRLQSSFDSSTQDDPMMPMMLTSIVFGCKQLQSLQFWGYFPRNVLTQVFRALKDNPSITSLLLDSCKGLDDTMFRDMMESLQLNTNLETISIKGTSWDREGKSAAINDALKFNKRQMAYMTILYQHGNVQPANPTAGRLFLCGPGFAGKTTLRASMIRAWSNSKHPSFTTPQLLDHLPSWVGPRRTQGIEIQMLRDDPTMQISIWDFAGQDKFRALQSYLFPTIAQPCVFFFVFNPYNSKTRTVREGVTALVALHSVQLQPRCFGTSSNHGHSDAFGQDASRSEQRSRHDGMGCPSCHPSCKTLFWTAKHIFKNSCGKGFLYIQCCSFTRYSILSI